MATISQLPDASRMTLSADKRVRTITLAAADGARVDAEAGRILGVSLMTADREASGHGVWIDMETLSGFAKLAMGRSVKSYVGHDWVMQWQDATGTEFGLFSGVSIDVPTGKLRADFSVLDSFRRANPQRAEAIFELAQKAPETFGVSLVFAGTLAWKMQDGAEMDCSPDDEMPDGAMYGMPVIRARALYSADFVSIPAANAGLLSAAEDKPETAAAVSPVESAALTTLRADVEQTHAKLTDVLTTLRAMPMRAEVDDILGRIKEADTRLAKQDAVLAEMRTAIEALATENARLVKLGIGASPLASSPVAPDQKVGLSAKERAAEIERLIAEDQKQRNGATRVESLLRLTSTHPKLFA